MKLLKAIVRSNTEPDREFYISLVDYDGDAPTLPVYNAANVKYGVMVKRENIVTVTPV